MNGQSCAKWTWWTWNGNGTGFRHYTMNKARWNLWPNVFVHISGFEFISRYYYWIRFGWQFHSICYAPDVNLHIYFHIEIVSICHKTKFCYLRCVGARTIRTICSKTMEMFSAICVNIYLWDFPHICLLSFSLSFVAKKTPSLYIYGYTRKYSLHPKKGANKK